MTITSNTDTALTGLKPGEHILSLSGTFGGATVKLQFNNGGGLTDFGVGASFTAGGQVQFPVLPGHSYSLNSAGGTGISITAIIVPVPGS